MIWNYVKSRAGTIVVFLLLYLTAGVVAALYGLSAVAVGYAGILCAVCCFWEPECGIFSAL